MQKLSPDDKYKPDGGLERLLDLDGETMEMGGGYWVKIEAKRVDPTAARSHGINYSLCLFSQAGQRLVCFDNAHPVAAGSGRGGGRKRATTCIAARECGPIHM